jgi:hypothetical protein
VETLKYVKGKNKKFTTSNYCLFTEKVADGKIANVGAFLCAGYRIRRITSAPMLTKEILYI